MPSHFVYILQSKDGKYYTGYTTDLDRRMAAHKSGKGAKFTRAFGFKKLLYHEVHPTKSAALKREAQLKTWSRAMKKSLIKGLIVFGISTLSMSAFSQIITPSFDCQKATSPQEKQICADSGIAKLDKHVGDTYSQLLKELSPTEAKTLQKNQKDWITIQRDGNCYPGEYFKTCLTEYYKERSEYLDARLNALHQPDAIRKLAGTYDYKEPHMGGDLEFLPTSASTAWAHISTGTAKGTCEFEGRGSLRDKVATLSNPDSPDCKVQIRFSGSTATVDTNGETCNYWCGVHAWFIGKFQKK